MTEALGAVLPLALGIAISPVPIIAVILMLLSPRARATSVGFLVGWLAGIVVAVTVFSLLSGVIPDAGGTGPQPIHATIKLLLGIVLLALAVRRFIARARSTGAAPSMPKWMGAIDSVSFPAALGLGALLGGVNPKNLVLGAAAGLAIGGTGLDVAQAVAVGAIYTLIAASTVLIPVVAYLVAASRLRAPLDALRGWLERENAVIMAVLMLVFGVVLIGNGIAMY